MLIIRFARVGKKNKAQYKISLQEKTIAPGGRHVEILGAYDPHSKKALLKKDRIKYWIEKGAQLSDTVHNLFVKESIISDKKRIVKLPTKKVDEVLAEKKEEVSAEIKNEETTEEKKEEKETAEKK